MGHEQGRSEDISCRCWSRHRRIGSLGCLSPLCGRRFPMDASTQIRWTSAPFDSLLCTRLRRGNRPWFQEHGQSVCQFGFGRRAFQPVDQLAVLKHEDHWNTLDPKSFGDLWLRIDIDFSDNRPSLEVVGELLDNRGHIETGRAPGRPKVNQYRPCAVQNVTVEVVFRQSDGMARLHV